MATSYRAESVEINRKLAIARVYLLRSEMSQILLDITSGKVTLSDVLLENADHPATKCLYVVKAFEAVMNIGKVNARRLMADSGIDEKCKIEDLSISERQLLLKKFETIDR